MAAVRLRVWWITLIALALYFAWTIAWGNYSTGWVATGVSMFAMPVAWIGACLILTWLFSLRGYAGIFAHERTRLSVRAIIQSLLALAAILGPIFGQFLSLLAFIDYRPSDERSAVIYREAFLFCAAFSLAPALIVAILIGLLVPRFWNSHLSLITQKDSKHA